MMTAQFVSWVSLFALLIVDICCFPYKKGSNPGPYGSSYPKAAPALDLNQGTPSTWVPTSHQAQPQPGPNVPQPTDPRRPAPSVSGPAFSGYREPVVRQNPASAAQPGAAIQPGPQDMNWASPSLSGGEEMSSGTPVGSSLPLQRSPIFPPEPMYQAGELSHFESNFDHGDNEMETEEQGRLVQPPPPFYGPVYWPELGGQSFTSQPLPDGNIGGLWGPYPFPGPYTGPYPFYDFMFLTGQYPPGTVSHASNSYEQGRNYWEDVHYERDGQTGPERRMEPITNIAAPQSIKDPNPVMAGYGQAGFGQAGTPASHGGFRLPANSRAGGHNQAKISY